MLKQDSGLACCCKGNCGGLPFLPIDTSVTVRCPAEGQDPETFMEGRIRRHYAHGKRNALYVIEPEKFKWARRDPWRKYDGIRFVVARQTQGEAELEWVRRWEGPC